MNIENSLGNYIGWLQHLLTKRLNEALGEANTNITADQLRLLIHLWQEDGVPQQSLATCLSRDRAGITRMADILENQGLITRIPDKNDRRVNLLYLTKAGKSLKNIAQSCTEQVFSMLCQGFTEDEKKTFETFLLKGIENLKT